MTQASRNDIEHPSQQGWTDRYAEPVDDDHKRSIEDRFEDLEYNAEDVIKALTNVTSFNHSHRYDHESLNLQRMGLHMPTYDRYGAREPNISVAQQQYEEMAGKYALAGAHVKWFSHQSHEAFVRQETLDESQKFPRISLELGGKRQFGDWEATSRLDGMIRSIPEQLIHTEPSAKITVYGPLKGDLGYERQIIYKPDAQKSYALFPRFGQADNNDETNPADDQKFRMAMLRRRRPVADIFITGQSDVVIFKESIGLLVIDLLNPGLQKRIYDDCLPRMKARSQTKDIMKFQDTPAARIAGALFERAIREQKGATADIIPVSAHYIQGVGEKYAQFRKDIKE